MGDEILPTAREAMRRAVVSAEAAQWQAARVWTDIARELREGSRPRRDALDTIIAPLPEQHIEASAGVTARMDVREAATQMIGDRFRAPDWVSAPTEVLIVGGAPQCAHCARPIMHSGTHVGAPWVHVESPFQDGNELCAGMPIGCVATPRVVRDAQ